MNISGVTIISGAVHLAYPVAAVLESIAPLCSELVVNIDVSRPDGTYEMVVDWLRTNYSGASQVLESSWNWDNRIAGSELAIQSNHAVDACSGDFVLYMQCDEFLHEDDHDYLKWLADTLDDSWAGIEFERLYFWRDLHTLRTDWTQPLVRMFRRGRGRVAGDGINCAVDGKVWPVVRDGPVPTPSIWHYSRVSDSTSIAKRIQTLDSLFHDPELIVNSETYDWELKSFDSYAEGTEPEPVSPEVLIPFHGNHPEPARKLYG